MRSLIDIQKTECGKLLLTSELIPELITEGSDPKEVIVRLIDALELVLHMKQDAVFVMEERNGTTLSG